MLAFRPRLAFPDETRGGLVFREASPIDAIGDVPPPVSNGAGRIEARTFGRRRSPKVGSVRSGRRSLAPPLPTSKADRLLGESAVGGKGSSETQMDGDSPLHLPLAASLSLSPRCLCVARVREGRTTRMDGKRMLEARTANSGHRSAS